MGAMSKKDDASFEYEGEDLEAMLSADNYYQWLFDDIRPYIGKYIVEVGAGVGSFSRSLLTTKPRTLHLIEPSKRTYKKLKENMDAQKQSGTAITVHNGYLSTAAKKLEAGKLDTFVYINVFEHIEDDVAELEHIRSLLKKNGHAIIFVPALKGLYSEFDKSIGHYRRYTKKSLRELCEKAGMEVVSMQYRDVVGIASWWTSFVLLRRKTLSPSLVATYDKFFVPIIRAVESRLRVPVGKNILLVAKKR